jgi:hypothetical protein
VNQVPDFQIYHFPSLSYDNHWYPTSPTIPWWWGRVCVFLRREDGHRFWLHLSQKVDGHDMSMICHDGPWWPMMALYPGCGTHWNAVCRFVQLHSSLVTCFEAQSTYQEHPRWGSRSPLAPVESSWMLSMNNLICVNHVNLQCAQLWLISTSGCGYTMGTLRQADHRIDWNWAHRSHHFKVPTTLPYPGALAARKS